MSALARDCTLRPFLKTYLRAQMEGRVVDEMNVGEARIDVAVIGTALHGFEIKAGGDSFARFEMQCINYEGAFDFLTLVTTQKKRKGALKRLEALPHWGLLIAHEKDDGSLVFEQVRKASANPRKHARGVVNLLWGAECLSFLEKRGETKGVRGSVWRMREKILKNVSLSALSLYTCEALRTREGWRDENGRRIPLK